MPPILAEYSRHLEEAGDRLPTFNGTYDFYKNEINEWFAAAEQYLPRSEVSAIAQCDESTKSIYFAAEHECFASRP